MKRCSAFLFTVLALAVSLVHAEEHGSYQRDVLDKAGNGFANLSTGLLEIPKNVINTSNDSNIVYGVVGGMLKGSVNMVGRMGVGLVDLVTAPIPTKPIVYPALIWDDFDADTQYGESFRLRQEYEK
jgi:putative exosortase-associated protein (TIGR04073 family)